MEWCSAGARAYMEDRHTVVASYSPAMDGISRSFAGVYDGTTVPRQLSIAAAGGPADCGMHLPLHTLPCLYAKVPFTQATYCADALTGMSPHSIMVNYKNSRSFDEYSLSVLPPGLFRQISW